MRSDVPLEWVLDADAYCNGAGGDMVVDKPWQVAVSAERLKEANPGASPLESELHRHPLGVGSLSVVLQGAVDQPKLEAWLALLLWEEPGGSTSPESDGIPVPKAKPFGFLGMEVYRMKAVFAARGSREDDSCPTGEVSAFKHLLQVVHGTFDITKTEEHWEPTEEKGVRLVAIGKHLDRRRLEKGLEACLVE